MADSPGTDPACRFWQRVEATWDDSRLLAWILILAALSTAICASVWPQSPGISIGLLALAAGIMSVRSRMHPAEKFAWVAVLVTFAVLEVLAIGRSDKQNEKTRNDQNGQFTAIANGLKTTIANSQQQFAATMASMGHLSTLEKQQLDEAIGGDSFCMASIINFTGSVSIGSDGWMTTSFNVFGTHPMSNIDVSWVDIDEADKLHRAQGSTIDNLTAGTTRLTLPYIRAGMGITPFVKIHWTPSDTYKRYNISVIAKNGNFAQILRIKRVGSSNETHAATLVTAGYFDGRRGLVYERIDEDFPRDLLATDNDWKGTEQFRHITVKFQRGVQAVFTVRPGDQPQRHRKESLCTLPSLASD